MNRLKNLSLYVMLAAASLFYLPLGSRALWDSDEGRYGEIGREMLELRDWISPHLNYVLYFEKPPLMYWLTAASIAVFGPGAFAVRFWNATFGLLTVGQVIIFGRRWKNERTGILAGGILATSLLFYGLTQFVVLDMALTFWTTLALLAASQLFLERAPARAKRRGYLLAVAVAGGLLTKGPIAFALPFITIALTLAWTRSTAGPGVWGKLPWTGMTVVTLLIAAPWYIVVSWRHPFFIPFFFVHEHLARYFTSVHHRSGPVYYFVPVLAAGFLPWIFFLPKVVITWLGHQRARMRRDAVGAMLVIWSGFIFLFFSLSHSKLIGYVLPIIPALALLLAAEWEEAMDVKPAPRWMSWGIGALILFLSACLVALKGPLQMHEIADPILARLAARSGGLGLALGMDVFILVGVWGMREAVSCFGGILVAQSLLLCSVAAVAPALDTYLSVRQIGETLHERALPEDRVATYGVSYEDVMQSLPFYAQRRVLVLGEPGELALGLSHASDAADWYVPPERAAEALSQLPGGSWIVTGAEHAEQLLQGPSGESYTLVQSQGPYRLLQKNT
ncbi:MAG TPA: phospholipid carrier-dependent glycosyltransferase [Elusimicrobiota bacterium]|nr:phospholipid carrier-dependent glycosyltransferase [Elusimicrobiota bacterium]